MSKGRSRHQSSRRRTYSARHHEVRERQHAAVEEEQYWRSDQVAAFEIEEGLDFEAPTSWSIRQPQRGRAA